MRRSGRGRERERGGRGKGGRFERCSELLVEGWVLMLSVIGSIKEVEEVRLWKREWIEEKTPSVSYSSVIIPVVVCDTLVPCGLGTEARNLSPCGHIQFPFAPTM